MALRNIHVADVCQLLSAAGGMTFLVAYLERFPYRKPAADKVAAHFKVDNFRPTKTAVPTSTSTTLLDTINIDPVEFDQPFETSNDSVIDDDNATTEDTHIQTSVDNNGPRMQHVADDSIHADPTTTQDMSQSITSAVKETVAGFSSPVSSASSTLPSYDNMIGQLINTHMQRNQGYSETDFAWYLALAIIILFIGALVNGQSNTNQRLKNSLDEAKVDIDSLRNSRAEHKEKLCDHTQELKRIDGTQKDHHAEYVATQDSVTAAAATVDAFANTIVMAQPGKISIFDRLSSIETWKQDILLEVAQKDSQLATVWKELEDLKSNRLTNLEQQVTNVTTLRHNMVDLRAELDELKRHRVDLQGIHNTAQHQRQSVDVFQAEQKSFMEKRENRATNSQQEDPVLKHTKPLGRRVDDLEKWRIIAEPVND